MAMTVSKVDSRPAPANHVNASEELESYRESLKELNMNSKPHINMLTMIAEENFHQGAKLVAVIEKHIRQVRPEQKLPALYLIDSIMKNSSKGDFKPLFRPALLGIFVHIFEQSDETTRKAMFKLRQTWAGILEPRYLRSMDLAVRTLDPKWPVEEIPVEEPPKPPPVVETKRDSPQPTSVPRDESKNGPTKSITDKIERPGQQRQKQLAGVNGSGLAKRKIAGKGVADLPRIPKKVRLMEPGGPDGNKMRPGAGPKSNGPDGYLRTQQQEREFFERRPQTRPSGPLLTDPPTRPHYEDRYNRGRGRVMAPRRPQPHPYREPRHHPRGPWIEPEPFIDRRAPYDMPHPPMEYMYMPPPPFIHAEPPFRRVDPFEEKIEEARMKLERGEITSAAHQQMLRDIENERELWILKEALDHPVLQDGSAPGRPYDTFHTVKIDNYLREVRWFRSRPLVMIDGEIFDISFHERSPPVHLNIDHIEIELAVNEVKKVFFGTQFHEIRLGGPYYELIIDDVPYRLDFGGPEILASVGGQHHRLRLSGPAPSVYYDQTKPLRDQIFGKSNNIIEDILSSDIFKQLLKGASATVAPDERGTPPAVNPNISKQAQEPVSGPKFIPAVQEKRISPAPRSPVNNFGHGIPAWKQFLRKSLRRFEESGTVADDEPNLRMFQQAVDNQSAAIIHYSSLRKLHLNEDFSSRSCEQRFLPNEKKEKDQNVRIHNWWIQKDEVLTGDWLMEGTDFVDEKSWQADTSPEELDNTFTSYILTRQPDKKLRIHKQELEQIAEAVPLKIEPQNPDEIIKENPVAKGSRNNHCVLCHDEIHVVDEEDEWVLKDAIRVLNTVTNEEREYHRECYEDVIKKKSAPEPLTFKPAARWGASSESSTSAAATKNAVPQGSQPVPTSEVSSLNNLVSVISEPEESDEFVVKEEDFGDGENDFLININDEEDEDEESASNDA